MKTAKSTRRVMLLSRMGSPTCLLHTGRPSLSPSGSGTAGAVTSDFTGNGYEVTVTKADGSTTEVHLDSSFNAFAGGPGGHDNGAPGQTA
jgi:hypothetical protein